MASSPTAISALNFTNPILPRRPSSPSMLIPRAMAKELYFNRDGSTTRKLQAGVDMVAELVGVTLGPKGRNVVLQNKYGPPKIVNDGETVLKEIELEDPLENVGVKLVRQAGAKTNDLAGDGSTTSVILAQGLIAEGVKIIAAGMNPVQVARGIEKTANALVSELKLISREVEDHEIAHVAAVSAGNDYSVGNMIADALRQVGRKGVVTIEKGKCTENNLQIVEGMQFDRGYLSPYFVTDRQKMTVEFHNCKLLLVDRKITNPKEMFGILDSAVKEKYPIVIVAEGIEKEALAPVIRNKLRGVLKAAAIKAPAFGERKSHYLDDIAILTGGTVIRDEMGLSLEKAGKEALGSASKVVITKDSTLIVTDGSTHEFVEKRVSQLQELVKNSEEKFQKKLLSERIARLSGGIAILQVGAQTQVELKDKQLRIEDALNATKAAIEEGVVVGGGCTLLRLSTMVDGIKQHLDNEEQKFMQVFSGNRISFSINVFSVLQSCNYFPLNAHKDCNVIYGSALQIGAEIFKRALSYPARLIAKNAGVNGNLVIEKVLSNDDIRYGYNAARDCYEDLVKAGIIDPSKVVRCCLEHAASVAKTFLTSDAVVVDIKELEPIPRRPPMPPIPRRPSMPTSGINPIGF
ncbi:chaperonin 60 subunit beta 4, chloroplastic isoform X1 [Carya illinoinensis]|uniref:chaperonin 60 subunit beta 4, chloroplastic isoform X1 n=1 Tax=Carya illinoinensis TaxID=32201 RepID=UPI001C722D77|nr:chaperonin 60 subunit beta 4, chloroplastic isoform X1 [Carya illinoinensis]